MLVSCKRREQGYLCSRNLDDVLVKDLWEFTCTVIVLITKVIEFWVGDRIGETFK